MTTAEVPIATAYKFRTPSPYETGVLPDGQIPEYVRGSEDFQKLVDKIIKPFADDSQQRIKVFQDGGEPFSPVDPLPKVERMRLEDGQKESMAAYDERRYPRRRAFEEQIRTAVAAHVQDFLQTDGSIKPENRTQWYNYENIVPELVRILTTSENHIQLVHEAHTVNIVDATLEMVEDSDTQITLTTGVGGSKDEFTSHRLAAYTNTATSIGEKIISFYEQRETDKFVKAAVLKVQRAMAIDQPMSGQQKKALAKRIETDVRRQFARGNRDAYLTREEQAEIRSKYAIAKDPVKLRIFSAHNAAIAINGAREASHQTVASSGMDPEKVRIRAAENMRVMREHIAENHPRLIDRTEFIEDKPWEQHTPYVQVALRYFAHVVRESDDPDIRKVIDELKKLGNRRGGENGEEFAALYAAMHPAAFGDQYPIPYIDYHEGVTGNPAINVTIGGRTERDFTAVREYIVNNTSVEGLVDYIVTESQSTTSQDETDVLRQAYDYIITAREQALAQGTRITHPPRHVIPLITDVGYHATYYANQFDRPTYIPVYWYTAFLQSEAARVYDDVAYAATQEELVEAARDRTEIEGVIHDINVHRIDQKKGMVIYQAA